MRKVEVYQSRNGRWRWRKIAANGQRTANPGQSFATKWNAKRSAITENPGSRIVVVPA
jgi:uncharacterized protein YegP (UPF0339 family)